MGLFLDGSFLDLALFDVALLDVSFAPELFASFFGSQARTVRFVAGTTSLGPT